MATTRKAPAKTAAKKTTATRKRAPRKTTPKPVDVQAPSVHVNVITEEQKMAKLEAYNALRQAGLAIPQDLASDVEAWIADLNAQREAEVAQEQARLATQEADIAEENKNGPWYVRNCYPASFNLRLDRQTEKRRIELKPRGTPGDLHPLKDEDLKDPVLKQNLNIGIIELIPAGVANQVIEKQTNNATRRVHTPLQVLANERKDGFGRPDPGEVPVRVEAEFNSQGVTVAQVDPRVARGELHDRQVGKEAVAMTQARVPEVRSGFVPTGGHPAAVQHGMDRDAHARAVDELARVKGPQGPAAGLGNVQVVVEPVQRT